MKFAIFGNQYQTKKSQNALKLFEVLQRHDAEIMIAADFCQFIRREFNIDLKGATLIKDENFDADFAVSMGGDGTFLRVAAKVLTKNIPIIGINTGRLGFLADISPDEIEETIEEIHQGKYWIEERTVLEVECNNPNVMKKPYALNEVAVLKRDSSSMISIETSVNGKLLTTYQADGLIAATPSGSTAYSLSVGGPIMIPQSKSIVLTPVAPHSLNVRPIVICDDYEVTMKVESRSHNFLVAIDGRSETCCEGTTLTIRKAKHPTRILKRNCHNFFNTLRNKMMWGADAR